MRTRTYRIWTGIKQRCLNENNPQFPGYGGRGIKICDRWSRNYLNFLKDMGECPPGLSLDRIDPNGNYEKSNCRWVTPLTQGSNKRNNRWIEVFGQRFTLAQLSRKTSTSTGSIDRWIQKGVLEKKLIELQRWIPEKSQSFGLHNPT